MKPFYDKAQECTFKNIFLEFKYKAKEKNIFSSDFKGT